MSLDVANLLLDVVPDLEGDGTGRLQAALSVDLDSDDRATVELARRIAENHFAAVSPERAVLLVDALAAELGLAVHAGREHRLAESLDALPEIIDDLDHRLAALPTPVKSTLRRRIAKRISAVLGHGDPASLPAGDLVLFAEAIEREEQKLARPTPPGPTRVEGTGAAGPGHGDAPGSAPASGEAAA